MLLNALKKESNVAYTDNGAKAFATTNSDVLDYFSNGGALRGADEQKITNLFHRAWCEDQLLALKALFYFRDIRGGQGIRRDFRLDLRHLAEISPETVRTNLHLIPEFGRWDDLYALFNTDLQLDVIALMGYQLDRDLMNMKEGRPISLLAKWLKSENTSSAESRVLATMTRQGLLMTSKEYRKMLTAFRKYIDVLERKTSASQWGEISYEKVPSQAMLKYRKAFKKHDAERFDSYLADVAAGKTKINAGTLYPQQIISQILKHQYAYSDSDLLLNVDEVNSLDSLWKNLPNYFPENVSENSIAVVDTSGSMFGLPMEVAIGLGIYLAERAQGPFKDHLITFHQNPHMIKVKGNNIVEKAQYVQTFPWGMNTNIEAVFNLILAASKNVPVEEHLDRLYIFSDMEFDSATYAANSEYLFDSIRKRFNEAGIKMPELVFWRVNQIQEQNPMSLDRRGFLNVSGYSPSTMKALFGHQFVDAYDLMLEVLNSPRYSGIVLAGNEVVN